MQYRVPQNVDIEDKVIGPLSLRQFIFILIGLSFILVLYFILVGPLRLLFWLLAFAIGAITGVFAFARYGDQPFEVFALGGLKTLTTPRQRIWKREIDAEQKVERGPAKEKRTQTKSLSEVKGDLGRLAQVVDSGGYIKDNEGGRIASFNTATKTTNDAPDLLNRTEGDNTEIDPLIERATKSAPKREALISEAAGITQSQNFNYPEVQVSENNNIKSIK